MPNIFNRTKNSVVHFYTNRSTFAFFLTLAFLFALIALSQLLRTPEPAAQKPERETKKSALYSEATPLYVQVLSTIKKEGVTPIVALTPGIVTSIFVQPGSAVQSGTTLVTITNDYNSGGAGIQKEITRNNLLLVQELNSLDKKIQDDQKRITETDDTLTKREERVALQALKKARETRNINLVNAKLNAALENVNDAVLKPKSLSSGYVQSISVKKGDYVTPGQTIATISNVFGNTLIEASVTSEIAPFIDITKEALITFADGTQIKTVPNYFSASEDAEGMFALRFMVSNEIAKSISVNENPSIKLPLRFTHNATTLVPLDAIFKNADSAVVLVLVDGKAEARTVELGRVRGNYIEVPSGLHKSDQIILNRFILAGDKVDILSE